MGSKWRFGDSNSGSTDSKANNMDLGRLPERGPDHLSKGLNQGAVGGSRVKSRRTWMWLWKGTYLRKQSIILSGKDRATLIIRLTGWYPYESTQFLLCS